ncbi:MAG: hypothetical protein GY807_08660 [Gammaproteobacteria bacterium]|nr:hypothetical protein [Gammaproteobacteria bacterium]
MGQAELEVQLRVWKDLAISKQVMMGTATDALGLDPECSTDELKKALDKAIKEGIEADVRIKSSQERASIAVAEMERRMESSQKALAAAQEAKDDAKSALGVAEQKLADGSVAFAKEQKKIKKQLAENRKSLKAINVALADTPENVIKKLRALKKQKYDEAEARRRAESDSRSLRKEKQDLEQRLTKVESTLEDGVKVVANYRDSHKLCKTLHEQLSPIIEDANVLPDIPELDEQLLEHIEQAVKNSEEK